MDYTVTYFFPIHSTEYCIRARSEMVNVPPRFEPYTTLPVSFPITPVELKRKVFIQLLSWEECISFQHGP